ncbi:unnamed protein product [Bursaphelenchus okinawaensis]|uniref:DH domain-containing protein n=1 Tax=Bursaphelenchus okinawaensis TaxID=465554 RepID=A0A811JUU7_9BILA|nr:unnamed protein product [Bursaphelenchus okinawaensis]CAG9083582.1 unnamed protein product [Bursaphelenchus okinawaensis]
MAHLSKVVEELIETEKSFSTELYAIVLGFNKFFLSDRRQYSDICALLKVLSQVRQFNKNLLKEFVAARKNCGLIGEVFTRNKVGFKVYFTYCELYPMVVERLGLLKRNEEFSYKIYQMQESIGVVLPLESYLLKPFQRILKYPLLLRKMMDYFFESPQERWGQYDSIKNAHQLMVDISCQLNEHKRQLEEKSSQLRTLPSRMDIQRRLIGCFRMSSFVRRRTQSAESVRNLTAYDIS